LLNHYKSKDYNQNSDYKPFAKIRFFQITSKLLKNNDKSDFFNSTRTTYNTLTICKIEQSITKNGYCLKKKAQKMGIIHVRKRLFLCSVKIRAELS